MAHSSWNACGNGGPRNQRPTMNTRQTEGERLHDQALAYCAHGNFIQAEKLLNRAIALEPCNASFRETRNSMSYSMQWPSAYHQQPTAVGHSFPEANSERRQFSVDSSTNTMNLPRQTWDNRRLQGRSRFPNGHVFPSPSYRSAWPHTANGNTAHYFSNTVADNVFGSSYWLPSEGTQNLNPQMDNHFGDPRPSLRENNNSSYAIRTNTGIHYGTSGNVGNASKLDSEWGEWIDPGVTNNPMKETSWSDSGFQQTDVPWTEEPRKAASAPNHSKSGAQGSASHSSLRGSMANSAEGFSMKGHYARAGRSSPQTWRSEETCSDTSYGLDNFEDASMKVQEWLVKNESSGVQNLPPGLTKPKKTKKKKKKKLPVPKQEIQELGSQTLNNILEGSKENTYSKQKPSPPDRCKNSVESKSDGQQNSRQKLDTETTHRKSVCSSNSDKPAEPIHSSLGNNNPNGTNSATMSNTPFFDPRRIFGSSNTSQGPKHAEVMKQMDSSTRMDPTKENEAESHNSYRRPLSTKVKGKMERTWTTGVRQSDQSNSRSTSASIQSHTHKQVAQENETCSPDKEIELTRLDSSGSVDSDVRMTKEEWEEIIRRMYEPLGIPSSHSPDRPKMPEFISAEEKSKSSYKQGTGFQDSDEKSMNTSNSATFEDSIRSQPTKSKDVGARNLPKTTSEGNTSAAQAESSNSSKVGFINMKDKLGAGILETRVPVCLADSSVSFSAPAAKHPHRFMGRAKSVTTESNLKTNPSCQTSSAKSVQATQKESNLSEDGNKLPAQPLPELVRNISTAPGVNSDNVPERGTSVTTKNEKGSKCTRSNAGNAQEAAAKMPSPQSTKTFWEPSRIFGAHVKGKECRKAQASASQSITEPTRTTEVIVSSQQTATLKNDTTDKNLTNVCDVNMKREPAIEVQKSCGTTAETCAPATATSRKGSKSSHTDKSNNLSSPGIKQAKTVPSNSSTSFSYVEFKKRNAQKDPDSVKRMDAASPRNENFTSSDSGQVACELLQGPGPTQDSEVRSATDNVTQSKDKDPETRSGVVGSKISSGNKPTSRGNTFQTSNTCSKSLNQAAAQAQECLKSKSAPKNTTNESQRFSETREAPSNKMPQPKPDVNTGESTRPHSGESKMKATSAKAKDSSFQPKQAETGTRNTSASEKPQSDLNSKIPRSGTTQGSKAKDSSFQPKQAETGTRNASVSGKPQSDLNSKIPQSGTTQGSRHHSSSGSGTKSSASRATASSRTKEDDIGPRQKIRKQNVTSASRAAADEVDIEDVDPWYKWTRAIGGGLWWTVCFIIFLLLVLLAFLYSTIKVSLKYIWHVLKEMVKLIQEHRQGERSHEGAAGGQRSWGSSNHSSTGSHRTPAQPTRSIDIPTSGGAAIKRLLSCNQDNPFEVLGVSSDATEEDIKKYYRRQCMLVHPDKTDLANAQEAFQILQRAYETLTDPVKRREYEMERRHAHLDEEMEDFVKKMEEVLNTLNCDVCHGKHRRYEVDRSPYSARYCRMHGTRHPAYEGDVWAETTHFGFKWHYYAMLDDRIFDITEWAACQDLRHLVANSCEVRYHVGTRSSRSSSRQRSQPASSHGFSNHHTHPRGHQDHDANMTEELLKELLRQFQQAESRGGGASGNCRGGDSNTGSQDRGRRQKKNRKKKR